MKAFDLKIDVEKFRFTNKIWNDLKLNSPINIGYVSKLIFDKKFNNSDEWKAYYFLSGEKRLEKIRELPLDKQKIIFDLDMDEIKNKLTATEKSLIYNYGRTEKELDSIAKTLYDEIERLGNTLSITQPECRYMVKYRVIGETWNGIILQEENTIAKLKIKYPYFEFKKTNGIEDMKYEVDYELYFEGTLISGIQIKPITYKKATSEEVNNTRAINKQKNAEYKKIKGVPVVYIYSNKMGVIEEVATEEDCSVGALTVRAIFLTA